MSTPYRDKWTSECGTVTLYCGDCLEVLSTLAPGSVDAVVTDPPYGMGETNANMSAGRRWSLPTSRAAWDGLPRWDEKRPSAIVETLPIFGECIIWGGQFFSLPINRCWLVWNKIIRNFQSSVCELAWTNLSAPVDAFDYSHGQLATEGKVHPTQKPLPLMVWCVRKIVGRAILDPFMGSGTTGVACVRLGRRFIGIELEPKYYAIAKQRIKDELARVEFLEPKQRETQRTLLEVET